jgi:hypothetical protein
MPTQIPLINAAIKQQITTSRSLFGSVEFIKKDGTIRRITFLQSAMRLRIRGTARGKAWSMTMDARHPNLMRVWSVKDRDFRTVNLDTVLNVITHRQTTNYRRIPHRAAFLVVIPLYSGAHGGR